jgi:hypothetical protein
MEFDHVKFPLLARPAGIANRIPRPFGVLVVPLFPRQKAQGQS